MGHHVYNDNYNKYNFGNVLQGLPPNDLDFDICC